jgi:S-adenosylhomocysteine hydrolase
LRATAHRFLFLSIASGSSARNLACGRLADFGSGEAVMIMLMSFAQQACAIFPKFQTGAGKSIDIPCKIAVIHFQDPP